MTIFRLALLAGGLALPLASLAQAAYPTPVAGDYVLPQFHFGSGEILPQLNLHYTTVGQPRTDKNGRVTNAVLIMHGTTGAGTSFISELFAGHLFGPGQPLDAAR